MWNQACSQSPNEMSSHKVQRMSLQILPCTVSQLLSASQVSRGGFAIGDWELHQALALVGFYTCTVFGFLLCCECLELCPGKVHQVSVVGVIRGMAPFVTNIQYSVDDMTGPPISVRQWVNTEDCAPASPGTYVKVTGSLNSFNGQRSLLAMKIRCIEDLNEITSHMLEVVQAHMQFFGKAFDVNMNTTAALLPGQPESILPKSLSTIQGQVLHVIRSFSMRDIDISFNDLKKQLDFLSIRDIRTSLTHLINEGHVFCTSDEHHFKSTEH